MQIDQIKPEIIIIGPVFPEPVEVITFSPVGNNFKIVGRGIETDKTYQPILTIDQLEKLNCLGNEELFDGDAQRFRIGIEALRWGLAHEYDPYFSLAIAQVDPLPHQLEAVYDFFLKLPRIRFLLGDDPGAGKTIMAGLLLKELKIRGLVERILIVTPANLTFQWQRELNDKFRENFEIIRGDVLRANYGSNPWQDKNQVITSVAWASRIGDAKESLLRSHWDLIIVDEAHKMSAGKKKTLAYQLGEHLSEMTDHYLLMTATPHKGDKQSFCRFLELLDRDVYADISSLDDALNRNQAPFYLRRTKESLVTFPDPQTGHVEKIFTNRQVQTIDFQLDAAEQYFYEELTDYVEKQSRSAADSEQSNRGRILGFTMAMLQRRFASSIFAVRRSLERMRDKRIKIQADPEADRQRKIDAMMPDEFYDLTEAEQEKIMNDAESVVLSYDPVDLEIEIAELNRLIDLARELEKRETEPKLAKLKQVLTDEGIFADPKMKLLLFTEHKDTLDYLVEKLRSWGLSVTQIHGGMKIGDRDTPGSRIYSEQEFRDDAQILVATEAAGEGINLQFCWLMINYDIPWNPVRLEQRMGRIHRYGQVKDCLILNFVASDTREGRVLAKLFERIQAIEADLDPEKTGKVFNVLGDIFPANRLERMIRDMYLHNENEDSIKARIVEEVDTKRLEDITKSALEGLAQKSLNLSAIAAKSAEAKERRLVPEAMEDFFTQAAPIAGLFPKNVGKKRGIYRLEKVPKALWPIGTQLEKKFGKLGRDYKKIVFNREELEHDPTLEWVTPGHPLFEAVRFYVEHEVKTDLKQGAVFFDINRTEPALLEVFLVEICDGQNNILHKRLFVMEVAMDGTMTVRQPTIFLDLITTENQQVLPDRKNFASREMIKNQLISETEPFLQEVNNSRIKDLDLIKHHLEISLNTINDRYQMQLAELIIQKEGGSKEAGLDGRIKQLEDKSTEVCNRLFNRLKELEQQRHCMINSPLHCGSAWVLPHPERGSPEVAEMVTDMDIERIAVEKAIAYEEARGWQVDSVEQENRGFDLISRKPHSEDMRTAIGVRFIEVKGRSGIGEVALTTNEYKTAERLKQDYWLYVVFNCATNPEIHVIQDPVKLGWRPFVKIEHYQVGAKTILEATES